MASEAILKQKGKIVDEIADKIDNSNSAILIDYRGLTVEEMTELRKKLRESETELKIYKNTLLKRAIDKLKFDLDEHLAGPSAIVLSNDVVSPAKVLSEYAKKHDVLKIKVGIIEKEISGLDIIKELASIPSREGLLTMLAGGMIATVKDLSISLNLLTEQRNESVETKEEQPKEEPVEEKTEEAKEENIEETNEEEEKKEEEE